MSSTARIQSALEKSFERQRIVFWYDADGEWWPEFEELQLGAVEKVPVSNNEFGIKHRIVRQQPDTKFLLYFRAQPQPQDAQNWLLDQLLSNGGRAFSPDRSSLALIDAGLAPEYKGITEAHADFFRSGDRISKLRELLKPDDAEKAILLKMIAVVCRCEPILEAVLLTLLGEQAKEKGDRYSELEKYGLHKPAWYQISAAFSYSSSTPAMLDFCLSLFRTVAPLGGQGPVLDVAQSTLLINRWKDSQAHRDNYIVLAERGAKLLNVSSALNAIGDSKPLLGNDTYRAIDLKIISDLRDHLIAKTISQEEIRRRLEQRISLFWAREDAGVMAIYRALMAANDFAGALAKLDLTIESATAGVRKYAESWWRLDQLYRQFLFHRDLSGQVGALGKLAEWLEGQYLNNYLSPLALRWQEWVDRIPQWEIDEIPTQREFHTRHVQPHLRANRKVLVVVSDALRYEAGIELAQRIMAEDRWTANVQPMLGVLPSYTQLGMAALLPHSKLSIDPGKSTVSADGVSTVGSENRAKILRGAHNGRAGVISTEAFLALNSKAEGRDLFREHEVIYVYHDAIDAIGHNQASEHETCGAVEKAMVELVRILKKAAAINFSTMVVTADHGFLYQERPLEESDFLDVDSKIQSDHLDRRFVLGAVSNHPGKFRTFTYGQLGLSGAGEVAFPKGVQRLRKQGAASRFVHGGTSLQEVVIPVIEVRKERADDTRKVGVDLIRTTQQITSGQVTITLVQTEPVGEKQHATEVRVGFFAKSGEQISEIKTLLFSSTAEDVRQRERAERFLFSRDADRFNNQDIVFRIDEAIPGTSQFAAKQEFAFRLKRAFDSDFDDV